MPSNWLYIDSNFPTFTSQQDTESKVSTIQNYLYMLVEQLRYSLYNLDESNINQTAKVEFIKKITEPIQIEIKDTAAGLQQQLNITALELSSKITDIDGNYSALTQEFDRLTVRVSNAEGNISSLVQTSDGLITRVENVEGEYSQLSIAYNGLLTRVEGTEGNYSTLSQTVNGLSSTVSNNSNNISTLQQTSESLTLQLQGALEEGGTVDNKIQLGLGGLSLKVQNGTDYANISLLNNGVIVGTAKTIQFTGEVVFKSDLSQEGQTVINAGNITTGELTAITLTGCSFDCYTGDYSQGLRFFTGGIKSNQNWVGGLYGYDDGAGTPTASRYGLRLYSIDGFGTAWALKIASGGGMSIESQKHIYMHANDYLQINSDSRVNLNNVIISASSYTNSSSQASSGWTFRTDGIYYNGSKKVSV